MTDNKKNISKESEAKKPRLKSLNIDGTKYKTNFTKSYEERKPYKPDNNKELTAFIPGKILKINVTEGQKVKEGTRLAILEAMKMKNRIIAPFAGTIKKIFVEENQNVKKNQIIIELE